jgi:hypothetical protein
MSDDSRKYDPQAIWREQQFEETPVIVDRIMNRRTQQLHVSTRSEIVMSIVAAMFFIAVLAWRLPGAGLELQGAGVAIAAAWIAITVFRFRRILWGSTAAAHSASTGLAYYVRELEIRRDHLRNAWLWHGPLFVSLLVLLANFWEQGFPGPERVVVAVPLLLLRVIWIAAEIVRRYRQAADIQREIDELHRLEERP